MSKGESKFRARLIELEKARSEYLNLSIIREQKLKSLRSEKRARQLEEYLNKYFLADAQIASIGPSRKSTLQSYGIETAKDVSRDSLLSIQGFGPALTNNLVAWRDSIECEFVFDSNKGMPQSLINEIDREVYHQRLDLESRLTNGKKQLEEITNEIYWNTGSCRQR
ncbi:hypothetical protein O9H85_20390 [Paenibacillus filicis]|uniref:DUF4332 domain-containing protein n=1 Tax=Paenibacillus gyeongsangnamensis TaxID=3388067 RepID=A0ABT4QD05_9BACL|nr:hypothetical protein [Paenibacillus filicis]MCZ8514740.1 hypothetical protein [Paenibacillus filicis]